MLAIAKQSKLQWENNGKGSVPTAQHEQDLQPYVPALLKEIKRKDKRRQGKFKEERTEEARKRKGERGKIMETGGRMEKMNE